MACENGVFNTWTGYASKKYDDARTGCNGINNNATIEYTKGENSKKYHVKMLGYLCSGTTTPWKQSSHYTTNSIEDAMKKAQAWADASPRGGVGGVHDKTGDYCASQVPAEPEPTPVDEDETTGILETIASFFGNGVPEDAPQPEPVETTPTQPVAVELTKAVGAVATTGIFDRIGSFFGNGVPKDPKPPQERTMSQNEKARIEEHIRNTDIDFKEEMKKERVKLTKVGNKAWEDIKGAVRDGTIPLQNYNNDFLRGKLEKEGYYTQEERPQDADPLRFGDQIQIPTKVEQEDFGGKEKPPAQLPIGGPIQYDREGRPTDMPMEPPRGAFGGLGGMIGGFMDMMLPPPMLRQEEEEQRLREIAEEEADLSPERGLESNEEMERKNRMIDVEKTDRKFEKAQAQITEEGRMAWESVRMKYLDFGGFNYSKEVQSVIDRHRIPEPVDCIVEVAPWDNEGWVDNCDTHGVLVRTRQRPTRMTPPKFGGKPCPPYSEVPQSFEEKPCKPIDAKWEWSEWRECGEDAVSGMQFRNTTLISEAKYGGIPYEYQKEERECTMPVVEEELPPVANIPAPNPVSIFDDIWGGLTGWIDFTDGTVSETPIQVDGGTSQDSLLPEQTTPVAPAETTPVVTEEPAETTVVEETPVEETVVEEVTPEEIPCCPDCPDGANCEPCAPGSVPCEPTVVETVVETITEGVTTVVDAVTDIFTPVTSEEPVIVDSATTQDSLLPAQTSTPASTTETPSPAEVTVNIVQQPTSSGGGGGQTATTTTETKEETKDDEPKTEEPEVEEDSNALKIVGGLAVLSGIGYWAYKKYA